MESCRLSIDQHLEMMPWWLVIPGKAGAKRRAGSSHMASIWWREKWATPRKITTLLNSSRWTITRSACSQSLTATPATTWQPTSAGRAYHRTDTKILKKENDVRKSGGSTAVTVILINGEALVVANVGDSRAVICEDGAARQLTVDHEPLKEPQEIESRGGFVTNQKGNVPHVDRQLAMSRVFGDRTLKGHISSDPDVVIEDIDEDAEFIILASDGLWKVMSNQVSGEVIKDVKDAQRAAVELIHEALRRGSKDDISCIVVRLC